MKYLFTLACLLVLGFSAQAQNVRITNNTGCAITMKLRSAAPGSCTILNSSPYVVINAGQTIAAPLSNFMTVGPTEWLIQVDFFNWSCSSLAALVGYGPCALPTTASLNLGTCCGKVTATYIASGTPGAPGSAQGVVFN